MDVELKELLTKLLKQQEDILNRIRTLEGQAHYQHFIPGAIPLPGSIIPLDGTTPNKWFYYNTETIC